MPSAERGNQGDQDAGEQSGRRNERPAELPSVHRPHSERRAGVLLGDRAERSAFLRSRLFLPRTNPKTRVPPSFSSKRARSSLSGS